MSVRDGGSLCFSLSLDQRWAVAVLLVRLAIVSFELVQLMNTVCNLPGQLEIAQYVPNFVNRLNSFEGLKLLK